MYEPVLPRFYYQTISKSQTLIAETLTVGNLLGVYYTDSDLTSDFEVTDYAINYTLRWQAVLFLELEKPVTSTVSLYASDILTTCMFLRNRRPAHELVS